ncbi:tyrosine-type recombinase/integrase [Neobacillus sp. PS2-9]|uniref:tyrosine-type recombinase/integrase n=1 Tax=Neobacillus sp. PS2-9 TaxID=3070676 RepID=UPI0027E0F021|nr:tyrosine-type recombinase/integrase [Neobacillus sp. PS2-9]WML56495.1 tyrosine-type recombinase/integrase [Neobacillus sp. PS2-9]
MITTEICLKRFKDDYSFRLEESTVKQYILAVEQLITYCDKPFTKINSKEIRRWMFSLELKEYKAGSLKTKLAGVKLFFKYCIEEGLLTKDPVKNIPFPEVEDKLPSYLQSDELIQLRELVKGQIEERAVIEVLYSTGVRLMELVEIKKEDINWHERIITIPKGKRKKERIVLFTRECAEHLKAYLDVREDTLPFVFVNTTSTGSMCPRTVQLNFQTYTKKLGIHMSPHTLRHTFAAHLAKKGMPLECIQVLLGHNGPHQTQLYARLYHQARKEIYDQWM